MTVKHVRFSSRKNTVHELPTPSPTYSLSTLASSGGPVTPPNLPAVLPGPTPYNFALPPAVSRLPSSPTKPYHMPFQLHATLAGPTPAIRYDCSYSPSTSSVVAHGISSRFPSEPATNPPVSAMTITSPHLPWVIRVHASRHGVVTVSDVLYAIYTTLRENIHASDFERLSHSDKRRARKAYEDRYHRLRSSREAAEEKSQGVKKVDFLMGKTRFMGLATTTNGPNVWGLMTA